ncbi:minor tail protein [Mycobacterium phage Gaia]|uniref:Minor tail protein n=1 Tax=Mycobacterium phage Gaia TaxID=1486472 RepID=A0A068F2C6_9CAUD|nr:tail terminator [Mycobacterium phage Gaia]AID58829.1 minor tail protein [Mycobacterium phage Gaia]AYQ99951.1 tail terminator [Mycobacterium phage Nebkiss]
MYPYAPRIVKDYLTNTLPADVRVSTKVPANRPMKLVTIKMVPARGGDNMVLSTRRLIIECWNADESAAGELSEVVLDAMEKAKYVKGNGIRDVVIVGSPGRLDNPDDPTPRFIMTVDVLLRAV